MVVEASSERVIGGKVLKLWLGVGLIFVTTDCI